MRIACLFPDDISVVVFCRTPARVLAESGHELITVSPVKGYRAEIAALGSRHYEIETSRYVSPAQDLAYIAKLAKMFRSEHVDVVMCFMTKQNALGPIAARLARVPTVVVAVRGLGQVFNQPTTPRERAVERVLSGFYRVAFRLADLAWFTNPGDMKFFLDRGACPPQKTYLTNNAVDPTLFDRQLVSDETIAELRQEFGLEPGDLCVLMIARLIWRKGVREFVETAELLKERMPNVKFLLIAPVEEGSPDAVPEDFVRAAEKSGNFRWLGFRRDIRELSALCDLAVLPSWYKEGGYPRALLEPMALGKPVIGADTPDCKGPVRVGENGYLVPPQDSAALAAAVEKVLSDPALMAEFGRASRSLIETEFNDNLVWPAVFRKAGIPLASSV